MAKKKSTHCLSISTDFGTCSALFSNTSLGTTRPVDLARCCKNRSKIDCEMENGETPRRFVSLCVSYLDSLKNFTNGCRDMNNAKFQGVKGLSQCLKVGGIPGGISQGSIHQYILTSLERRFGEYLCHHPGFLSSEFSSSFRTGFHVHLKLWKETTNLIGIHGHKCFQRELSVGMELFHDMCLASSHDTCCENNPRLI